MFIQNLQLKGYSAGDRHHPSLSPRRGFPLERQRVDRPVCNDGALIPGVRRSHSPGSPWFAPVTATRRSRALAGFTLVEMVISAALMSLILSSAYMCLSAGTSSQKLVESRVDAIQNARVAMSFMAADLRSACALSMDSPFLGMQRSVGDVQADNIDFGTRNYTPKRPHEGDYCQVSYFLQRDPATGKFGLWRRRNPANAPDPLTGGRKEEIAQNVKGLRFQYYDGLEWYDQWGEVDAPKRGRQDRQENQGRQDNSAAMDTGNLNGNSRGCSHHAIHRCWRENERGR